MEVIRCPRALVVLAALTVLVAVLVGTRAAEAAFPGANGRIAFSSNWITANNPEGDYEIFAINPNGTNLTQLTSNTAGDFFPAYSPDGTRMAFVSTRDGNDEIYAMNVDGTGQTRLTNDPANDFDPDWQSL